MKSRFKKALVVGVALFVQIPAQAGPQSLLDPYASIQAPASNNIPAVKSKKVPHISKAQSLPQVQPQPKAQVKASAAPEGESFMSGLKEIEHGYLTSFKAAGQGVISGSKVAGGYIATGARAVGVKVKDAGGRVKDGVGVMAQKISKAPHAVAMKTPAPQAKQEKQISTASNASSGRNIASLPGKPLDSVVDRLPQRKTKNAPVNNKQGAIAQAFHKLNVFSKNKDVQQNNVAANPQKLQ